MLLPTAASEPGDVADSASASFLGARLAFYLGTGQCRVGKAGACFKEIVQTLLITPSAKLALEESQ